MAPLLPMVAAMDTQTNGKPMKRLAIFYLTLAFAVVVAGIAAEEWLRIASDNAPIRSAASDAQMLLNDAREYGALTNLCKLLVSSGEFCRVRGHAWQANLHGYPAEQLEKPEWRECAVCGREEERPSRNAHWHWSNAPYAKP